MAKKKPRIAAVPFYAAPKGAKKQRRSGFRTLKRDAERKGKHGKLFGLL